MIWLSEADMRSAVTCADLIGSIEEAFRVYGSGDFCMPDRISVSDGANKMLYMPCVAGDSIGTKMLAEFPGNPARGLPYLSGLMIVNNRETGRTEAVMDGSTVTALRTGAVGGLAVKHFSRADASRVGLIGCGVQGLHQLMFACSVRPIREIRLLDGYKKEFGDFIGRLRQFAGEEMEISVCRDARELVEASDIVITATQAREPVVPDDAALLRGRCFVAIGSWQPQMRELPDALWQAAERVYTDLPFAKEESGDLSQPLASGVLTEDRIVYMADYLAENGSEPRVIRPGETTCYKSVGMGIFDAVAAQVILKKALEKGLGQEMKR